MPAPVQVERVFLVSYDVADDKRRSHLAKLLEAHGQRVQWSVFEVIATPGDITAVLTAAAESPDCFDPGEDSLRCYPLCARCRAGADVFGTGTPLPQPGRAIVL